MEAGDPSISLQVNPYMFTTALANLAKEKGAKVIYSFATQINYKENGKALNLLP